MSLRRDRTDGRRSVSLQSAARLGRLRTWLTVLLLVLNTAGLVGMGGVALLIHAEQREEVEAAELLRAASTAVALLSYDAGALDLGNLSIDPTAQGSAGVYVFEGLRDDVTLVFAHPAQLPVIPAAELTGPARSVWRTGAGLNTDVADGHGERLRLLAMPFRHPVTTAVAGTVIVVGDARPGQQAHRRLAGSLVAGGALFMLVTGVGGHLLARRGTRPAVETLGQQERFIADAAHELRAPLTAMRLLSEAALTDPGRQPETLRQVLRSTERLADSVDALLTRARLVAGLRDLERQPFRLDQLAEEVVAEHVQSPHTAHIVTTPAVTNGDPTLVRMAVQNLVTNAIRHGRIDRRPCQLTLTVSQGQVRVGDEGPGLGDWSVDPTRQRFRTGATDGVGLGLAITAWVAMLHGGELRLEYGPSGGTDAVLTLADRVSRWRRYRRV
ncbi:sensor histidine kinase [Micromonospora sp. LOL_024]|uniref:sensor histidine kinase n=1 Tax=Micromonospora sp. LOL_024 TaxID=3345412 RepID=UPI003A88EF86